MDRQRAAFVTRLAEKLLKKHRVTKPPVDPFAIAKAEGFLVQLVAGQPSGHCGWLQGMAIGCRKEDPAVRQRFTVAHELGHHFLRHADEAGSVPSLDHPPEYEELVPSTSQHEVEANAFANGLLMPVFLLQQTVKKCRSPQEAAKLFQVSGQAMFIALQTCNLLGAFTRS